MNGISCGIVGAVLASVAWIFVMAWVRDQHAAERREWRRGAIRWRSDAK